MNNFITPSNKPKYKLCFMVFATLLILISLENCNLVSDDCGSVIHPRDELTTLSISDSNGNNLIRLSNNIIGLEFANITETEQVEIDTTFTNKLAFFLGRNDSAENNSNHSKVIELGLYDSNGDLNLDTIEINYNYLESQNCPFIEYGNLQLIYNNTEVFNEEYMHQIEIIRP